MTILQRCLAAVLVVVVLCASAAPAVASVTLHKELEVVAKGIKKLLDDENQTEISMGQFSGPPQLDVSGGPGIAHILTAELSKVGITVKRKANLGIKGEYRDVTDKMTSLLAVQLTVNVVDRTGKTLLTLQRGLVSNVDIAHLLGITANLPPKADDQRRNKELEKNLEKPSSHIDDCRVSASADSPYALEILVEGKPRSAKKEDGLIFVEIKRGETYAVRLINNSRHEAAVVLKIDGLSMYAFSDLKNPKTGLPRYSHVIVPAAKQLDIKGWHRTNALSNKFLVSAYAEGADYLHSSANVGTITASFAACWSKDEERPEDELSSRSANFTDLGPPIKAGFVELRRTIGVVRSTVSIRYSR